MAYNNYFPQFFPNATPQPGVQNPSMVWIQGGETTAKSYPVGPGQSVLLMDVDNSVMFIKSADQSGMPQPLRIFDYTERGVDSAQNTKMPDISREEFDELKAQVRKLLDRKESSKYNKGGQVTNA